MYQTDDPDDLKGALDAAEEWLEARDHFEVSDRRIRYDDPGKIAYLAQLSGEMILKREAFRQALRRVKSAEVQTVPV